MELILFFKNRTFIDIHNKDLSISFGQYHQVHSVIENNRNLQLRY